MIGMKKRGSLVPGKRIFPLDELDGFYVDAGVCVHFTFEDDRIIVIDVFNDGQAAEDPSRGDLICAVRIDLSTGKVDKET